MNASQTPPCRNCGKPRTRNKRGSLNGSKGWCSACLSRWRRAGGDPEAGPPAAQKIYTAHGSAAGRRQEYFSLRDTEGLTVEQAAARIGVTPSTAWRYEARRRRERGTPSRFDISKAAREDFAFLREQGEPIEDAAQRVGVAPCTGGNWERKRLAGVL